MKDQLNKDIKSYPSVRLIALDLDKTLFDNKGNVSEENIKAIHYAMEHGVEVVIATGRAYATLPFEQLKGVDLTYAITINGASAIRLKDKKQLFEESLPDETVDEILKYLSDKDVYIMVLSGYDGISDLVSKNNIDEMEIPEDVKEGRKKTQIYVEDIMAYLRSKGAPAQKFSLNFKPLGDGTWLNREEIKHNMEARGDLTVVCGGFHNLEVTRAGVDKGTGLLRLAEILGIDQRETMAIGDSENDLAMIRAAGIGVAMGNAEPLLKDEADYITASNEEDGVAKAIYNFVR